MMGSSMSTSDECGNDARLKCVDGDNEHAVWKAIADNPLSVSIVPASRYFGDSSDDTFYDDKREQRYEQTIDSLRNQPNDSQRAFLGWALEQELPAAHTLRTDCLESDSAARKVRGGIVGDECGLGKSFQALALTAANTPSIERPSDVLNNATLIVAPANVVHMNWQAELQKHLDAEHFDCIVYMGANRRAKLDGIRTHYTQTIDYANVVRDASSDADNASSDTTMTWAYEQLKHIANHALFGHSASVDANECSESSKGGDGAGDRGDSLLRSTLLRLRDSAVRTASGQSTTLAGNVELAASAVAGRLGLSITRRSTNAHEKPTRTRMLSASESRALQERRDRQNDVRRGRKSAPLSGASYTPSSTDTTRYNGRRPLIVVTSYETLHSELVDVFSFRRSNQSSSSSQAQKSVPSLFELIKVWHRVVFDEVHVVRNRDTDWYRACARLVAVNRWALSATLFVNHLDDYYTAFQLIGAFTKYRQWSTEVKGRASVLRSLLDRHCISRSAASSMHCEKKERYVQVKMTPEQYWLYTHCYNGDEEEFALISSHMRSIPKCSGRSNILRRIRVRVDFLVLRLLQLANQPYAAFSGSKLSEEMRSVYNFAMERNFRGSNRRPKESAIVEMLRSKRQSGTLLDRSNPDYSDEHRLLCYVCFDVAPRYRLSTCEHAVCVACAHDLFDAHSSLSTCACKRQSEYYLVPSDATSLTPSSASSVADTLFRVPVASLSVYERGKSSSSSSLSERDDSKEGSSSGLRHLNIGHMGVDQVQSLLERDPMLKRMIDMSGKHRVLMQAIGALDEDERAVVSCQWIPQIRILELLFKVDNVRYAVIEGATHRAERVRILDEFNSPITNATTPRILLMQSRTCGTGINIRRASVMFVLNKEYNSAAELQQMSRIHRMDQVNPSIQVVHLISHHTIEKRLQRLQRAKMALKLHALATGGRSGKAAKMMTSGGDFNWQIRNAMLLRNPNPAEVSREHDKQHSAPGDKRKRSDTTSTDRTSGTRETEDEEDLVQYTSAEKNYADQEVFSLQCDDESTSAAPSFSFSSSSSSSSSSDYDKEHERQRQLYASIVRKRRRTVISVADTVNEHGDAPALLVDSRPSNSLWMLDANFVSKETTS